MIKLKDLLTEAKAGNGERYQHERTAAAGALRHLVQSVEFFRSPPEKGQSGYDEAHEKWSADTMAKFVDLVHKLEKDWFRMTRKI